MVSYGTSIPREGDEGMGLCIKCERQGNCKCARSSVIDCVSYVGPDFFKKKYKRIDMQLYLDGLDDVEIAKIVGCSSATVFRWRKENKLLPNLRKSVLEYDKCLKLYELNMSDKKIAKALGVSDSTVYLWRKHNKLPHKKVNDGYKRALPPEEWSRAELFMSILTKARKVALTQNIKPQINITLLHGALKIRSQILES